uniref:peptidylprolyl isomerase n=1 Tax=Saccoglossus kowalevskii TaxID=10224 RepID=A0ABM0MBB8_SACKO|nr:PREDICTED: FK506-binding protein 15-like [Saccoglossus kowalevskii]
MFGGDDDDDGDFLMPGGSSKLSSLFGMDRASNTGGNASLTYTAPKQPKKQKETASDPAAPKVLHAIAVQAFKYINGQYNKQGKLGAAVLGNHANNEYQILLYLSKKQQVSSTRITASFSFVVQANNYGTFYDDTRQNWSIMFESEQNALDFTKQIALSKVNSAGGNTDGVITQDMILGDGLALDNGDSVEVKYTGWIYSNHGLGKVFDSNANSDKSFRFKIGKGKVIKGWDEGVLGMKKGGKRLLIIPPFLAYGSTGMGNRVPPNSTLIFEVEIKKVKFSKDREDHSSSSSSPVVMATQDATESTATDSASEESVRARTASINEQLAATQPQTQSKAKLISRMAKMGQPMLPRMGSSATQADSVDSEVEDHTTHQAPAHPSIPAKPDNLQTVPQQPLLQQTEPVQQLPPQTVPSQPLTQPLTQPMQAAQPFPPQQLALYQSQPQMPAQPFPQYAGATPLTFQPPQPMAQVSQYGMAPTQQMPQVPQYSAMYPQSQPPQQQPVGSDMTTPMLLSETRQQQTEIRLAIGKLQDKIETVSSKIDHMHVQGSQSVAVSGQQGNMESGILMQNIQRIVQENERLKREMFEKSSRIEVQNEKISELLQRNQQFVEQSNVMIEQRNDSFKNTTAQSQARVLELEQEKVNLTTELSAATSRISTMQLEIANQRQAESDLKLQLQNTMATSHQTSDELHMLKTAKFECESKIEKLSQSLKEEKLDVKKYRSRLENLEEELSDLRSEKEILEKNLSDRKQKAAAEKRKSEEEIEELKRIHEPANDTGTQEEVESLRSKLRKQKTSTDAAAAEQVSQVEKELESQYAEKCQRLVAQNTDKHTRLYDELKEEKEEVVKKLQILEQKFSTLKSSHGEGDRKLDELQQQVDVMAEWKDKYEFLQRNNNAMKERYESRIQELSASLSAASVSMATSPTSPISGGFTRDEMVEEVKKIMNNVYYTLRKEFEVNQSYTGSEILATMLNTIKTVTMQLVGQQESKETDEESESEEETEEETDGGDDNDEDDDNDDDDDDEATEDDKVKVSQNPQEPGHQGPPTPPLPEDLGPPASPPPPPPLEEEESKPESESVVTDMYKTNQADEPEAAESDRQDEEDGDGDGGAVTETKDDDDEEQKSEEAASAATEDSQQPQEEKAEKSLPSQQDDPTDQAEGLVLKTTGSLEVDQPSEEENNAQLPESEQIAADLPSVASEETAAEPESSGQIDVDLPSVGSSDKMEEPQAEEAVQENAESPAPEDEKEDIDNIFGADGADAVEDTFGPEFTKEEEKEEEKKEDESSDEDVTKPKPPPPLFPDDDDDDDDLDWLN